MKLLTYSKQKIFSDDIASVKKALKSNFLTTGPTTVIFEKKIKNYLNSKYVLSCSSGTSALFMAFSAINIKKNDIVICPINNFVATTNLLSLFDANIIFVDINEKTGALDINQVEKILKRKKIKKVKAVVNMHIGGIPNDVEKFYKLKKKYKFFLIEDSCHAFGSTYYLNNKNYKIGSCNHADISTFSFHPLKTITTCEGGCLTTNNKKIFQKSKLFRSHGISRNNKKHYSYDVKQIGLNLRLSDLNSALGITQLKKVNFIIKRRNEIAGYYNKKFLNHKKFRIIKISNKNDKSCFHLYRIQINLKKFNINKLINHLKIKNIISQKHYIPLYEFSYYKKKYRLKSKNFPCSNEYFKKTLSIPIHLDCKKKDLDKVYTIINEKI